jgi:hypothetical protein
MSPHMTVQASTTASFGLTISALYTVLEKLLTRQTASANLKNGQKIGVRRKSLVHVSGKEGSWLSNDKATLESFQQDPVAKSIP